MRSDSELLILIFRSEKNMGLFMQSDFAKSDGIKSDLRNPIAQVVRFWPKIQRLDPSDYQKSKNGIGLLTSKNQAEQSRPGTAAVRGTH